MADKERKDQVEHSGGGLPPSPSERGEDYFKRWDRVVYFQNNPDGKSFFIAGEVEKVWQEHPANDISPQTVVVKLNSISSNGSDIVNFKENSTSLILYKDYKAFEKNPLLAKTWLENHRTLVGVKDLVVKKSNEIYDSNFVDALKAKKIKISSSFKL
jgi:hypothetical protein